MASSMTSSGRLRKRRNVDFDHAQSKIQIAAKLSFGHSLFQITIRGGDRAHIDFDRLISAYAFERMAFQHAEELGLDR